MIYRLKNEQAAKHLLDSIDTIYDRLEGNPFQLSECRDVYLAGKEDREVIFVVLEIKGIINKNKINGL